MLGDDFCEAIVLIELSQLASRSQLKRKEAFYKYLAMKRAKSCEPKLACQLFTSLSHLYGVGFKKFQTEFINRTKTYNQLVTNEEETKTEDLDIYLKREFNCNNRQIDQWPFAEGMSITFKPNEVKQASLLHLKLLESSIESAQPEDVALIRLFMLDNFH